MLNKSMYRVVEDVDPYRFVLIVYLITVILFFLSVRFQEQQAAPLPYVEESNSPTNQNSKDKQTSKRKKSK